MALCSEKPLLEHALWHLVAVAAAGLVALLGPDQDDRRGYGGGSAVYEALRAGGVPAAAGADCPELYDLVGLGHEGRHRAEGFAAEVHVEARGDHVVTGVGQAAAGVEGAPGTPNQLLRLAGEHRARYNGQRPRAHGRDFRL